MDIINPKIYKTKNLTFVILDKIIIVRTPLQSFYLNPKAHQYRTKLKFIERKIVFSEIEDLNELSHWCYRFNIEWVTTSRKIDIENSRNIAYN